MAMSCKLPFFRMNVLHAINLHLCVDTIKVLTEEKIDMVQLAATQIYILSRFLEDAYHRPIRYFKLRLYCSSLKTQKKITLEKSFVSFSAASRTESITSKRQK